MKFGTFTFEKVILNLSEPSYGLKIAREIKVSYANLSRIISELEKEGIVQRIESLSKRTKLIELTEKGRKIRNLLIQLKELE